MLTQLHMSSPLCSAHTEYNFVHGSLLYGFIHKKCTQFLMKHYLHDYVHIIATHVQHAY